MPNFIAKMTKGIQQYRKRRALVSTGVNPFFVIPTEQSCPKIGRRTNVVLVHHQACTGGTLVSRCLAALPGTRLLSEIHPFYTVEKPFSPSAPVDQYIKLYGALPNWAVQQHFRSQVELLANVAGFEDKILILRDHSHADFMQSKIHGKTPVRDYLTDFSTVSLVTIRHPLDSFLSAMASRWTGGVNNSLATYSGRYMRFLDAYEGTPKLKYEELTANPVDVIEKVCLELNLTFDYNFATGISQHSLSGDSGRSSSKIGLRKRRNVPAKVEAERKSPAYQTLCNRLGYDT